MRSLAMDGVIGVGASRRHELDLSSPKLRAKRELLAKSQARVGTKRLDGLVSSAYIAAPVPIAPFSAVAPLLTPDELTVLSHAATESASRRLLLPSAKKALVTSAATLVVAAGLRAEYVQLHPSRVAHAYSASAAATAAAAQARDASVQAIATETSSLQQQLTSFAAANGPFSIAIIDLKTGAKASINADQSMESASLYKLFVAQGILQRVDTGQLSLSQSVVGTNRNVSDCLSDMITISDNTCGRALGDILGWNAEDGALHANGYGATTLGGGPNPQLTSATDVTSFLSRLYAGTLLSPNSTTRLLDLMKQQQINDRLPVGLPAGTLIAHKTGDLDGFVHDAGIVYGPKGNYVVTVMSGPWSSPADAPAKFADLSSKLYKFFAAR